MSITDLVLPSDIKPVLELNGLSAIKLIKKNQTVLNVKESDERYLTRDEFQQYINNVSSYDWTPNEEVQIWFTLNNGFVTPSRGWLIINPSKRDIIEAEPWTMSINGYTLFNCDDEYNMSVLILLAANDKITTTTTIARDAVFLPCKSADVTSIEAEPWHIANEVPWCTVNGELKYRSQYVPDASAWNSSWATTSGNTYNKQFAIDMVTISNNTGWDANRNNIITIETNNIANGANLCKGFTNLTSVSGNFAKLTNGTAMFSGCSRLNTLNNGASMTALITADDMFNGTALTSLNRTAFGDLITVTSAANMLKGCSSLTEFKVDMNNLTAANDMFSGCTNLTSVQTNIEKLVECKDLFKSANNTLTDFEANMAVMEDGTSMFDGFGKLNYVRINVPALKTGNRMFYNCTSLASWPSANSMAALETSTSMFYNCNALKEFNCDLPEVTDATSMFELCNNLTRITSNMQNLTSASGMLNGCSKLQEWDGSLAKLVNAKDLFKSAQGSLITVTTDLSSMIDGRQMFNNFTSLSSYSGPLTRMEVGTEMFVSTNIASFVGVDLSSLKVAPRMFSNNKTLTTFACDLPTLTNSAEDNENLANITNWKPTSTAYAKNGFFNHCESLESFSGNLRSLVSGYKMFVNCYKLGSFDAGTDGLKSLECGALMFMNCGDKVTDEKKKFTTFSADLSALKDGYGMFWGIDSLTSFYAGEEGLKSLLRGVNMFSNCTLDGDSVEHILTTIPTYTETPIEPVINLTNNEPVDEHSGKGYLQICMQQSAAERFVNIYTEATGVTPNLGADGLYSVDGNAWMNFRGWKLGARIMGYVANS